MSENTSIAPLTAPQPTAARTAIAASIALLEGINDAAATDMLAGTPITVALDRAIEAALRRMRAEQE